MSAYTNKYITESSGSNTKILKMKDLELNKEYFIKKIDKTKYGYICKTVNTEIDLSKKLKLSQLKDEKNNVVFYSNKSLNNYIEKNNIAQFCLRINEFVKFKKDNIEYVVPKFDVAILKQERVDLSEDDYDELAEKMKDLALD